MAGRTGRGPEIRQEVLLERLLEVQQQLLLEQRNTNRLLAQLVAGPTAKG
jgi:hypothetical protein